MATEQIRETAMARYGLYTPAIGDRNVRRLYRLKVELRERTGRRVPMTALLDCILDAFFESTVPCMNGEELRRHSDEAASAPETN
jgi:hypothetical protein